VDYSSADRPSLVRVSDGHPFKTDSAFDITPTDATGVECTVRAVADVRPGDCGLVPFADASPEWKNPSSSNFKSDIATIVAQGGVGAVVQGDVARNLVYALRTHSSIPAVVSVVGDDIVGQRVRLRAMGASVAATAHNVVGVLRPPAGSSSYVLLTAHMDGWYQAAADNGGGAAAVLRAAQLIAQPTVGRHCTWPA